MLEQRLWYSTEHASNYRHRDFPRPPRWPLSHGFRAEGGRSPSPAPRSSPTPAPAHRPQIARSAAGHRPTRARRPNPAHRPQTARASRAPIVALPATLLPPQARRPLRVPIPTRLSSIDRLLGEMDEEADDLDGHEEREVEVGVPVDNEVIDLDEVTSRDLAIVAWLRDGEAPRFCILPDYEGHHLHLRHPALDLSPLGLDEVEQYERFCPRRRQWTSMRLDKGLYIYQDIVLLLRAVGVTRMPDVDDFLDLTR